MPKVNRYDVYDNGELILEGATRTDIKKAIGDAPNNITNYADRDVKFKGRYTFDLVSEYDIDITDADFIKEWKAAVDLFKNVIWVKTGGRKLVVGGSVCQRK